jgi:hypothetical protein
LLVCGFGWWLHLGCTSTLTSGASCKVVVITTEQLATCMLATYYAVQCTADREGPAPAAPHRLQLHCTSSPCGNSFAMVGPTVYAWMDEALVHHHAWRSRKKSVQA